MSQNKIPDFTETRLWAVCTALKERYGKEIEPQRADSEVMLGGADGIAWCPALFWSAKGANFTIAKLGIQRYQAYFVESDHLRQQKIGRDRQPAREDKDSPDKPDTSPLFWGE